MVVARSGLHFAREPRGVAQLAEHRSPKPGVAGSSPAAPVLQVSRNPRVAGVSLFSGSPSLSAVIRPRVAHNWRTHLTVTVRSSAHSLRDDPGPGAGPSGTMRIPRSISYLGRKLRIWISRVAGERNQTSSRGSLLSSFVERRAWKTASIGVSHRRTLASASFGVRGRQLRVDLPFSIHPPISGSWCARISRASLSHLRARLMFGPFGASATVSAWSSVMLSTAR